MTRVSTADTSGPAVAQARRRGPAQGWFWALTIGSIGVVYGDIGTSPLYALRESVLAAVGAGRRPTRRLCSASCR